MCIERCSSGNLCVLKVSISLKLFWIWYGIRQGRINCTIRNNLTSNFINYFQNIYIVTHNMHLPSTLQIMWSPLKFGWQSRSLLCCELWFSSSFYELPNNFQTLNIHQTIFKETNTNSGILLHFNLWYLMHHFDLKLTRSLKVLSNIKISH